jgi:hypothetical protein
MEEVINKLNSLGLNLAPIEEWFKEVYYNARYKKVGKTNWP